MVMATSTMASKKLHMTTLELVFSLIARWIRSNAEMDRIEAEVHEMTKAQQKYDTEMAAQQEAAGAPPADAQPSEQETKAIEERISAIFTHVYDLAEKMGDADID